jgi:hypothetical protein
MIRRRQINAGRRGAPVRSLFAHVAERTGDVVLAVRERVVWNGGRRVRGASDVLRWPLERVAWMFERRLAWPIAERAEQLGLPLRGVGATALALIAAGVGVLGLAWASSDGGTVTARKSPTAPAIAAIVRSAPKAASSVPPLQGAAPDFTPDAGHKASTAGGTGSPVAKGSSETTESGTAVDATTTFSTASASSSAAAKTVPAGPAAMKVARRFAGAFVLYETGRADAGVRAAFGETASPQLAHALLSRPPRQPASVKVPKAKVLNIVAGPLHGETHTLSVSLLRVGVTSELRIDVAQDEKSGEWQVTNVLG